MKTRFLYRFALAITLFIAFGWTPVYTQDTSEPMISSLSESSNVTLAQMTERREEAANDTFLTESQKATALALFDRAIQRSW